MSEKCFCHLNGYKVKDSEARKQLSAHDVVIKGLSEGITELSEKLENGGGGGGKTIYKHEITFNYKDYDSLDNHITLPVIYSSDGGEISQDTFSNYNKKFFAYNYANAGTIVTLIRFSFEIFPDGIVSVSVYDYNGYLGLFTVTDYTDTVSEI